MTKRCLVPRELSVPDTLPVRPLTCPAAGGRGRGEAGKRVRPPAALSLSPGVKARPEQRVCHRPNILMASTAPPGAEGRLHRPLNRSVGLGPAAPQASPAGSTASTAFYSRLHSSSFI